MAMPLVISSSSNNQKQLGFTISSNNYRNHGGRETVMNNNRVSSNYSNQQEPGFTIATNVNAHRNMFLSLVPHFNGGDQQVMNNRASFSHSNQSNGSLSLVPSFNGGDQQVINGVTSNHSNGINRSLSLVPSFNDCERVMNNEISSNYSSNQQELGFSVSSSNHRHRTLSLVPSFNDYETVMNAGVSSNYCNQQKLGFSVSSSNHINRRIPLVPNFNHHDPFMNNGMSPNYSDRLELGFPASSRNHQNRSLSLVPSFKIRGEPLNMIERRRKFARNYQFSHSARLLAAREILRGRLISVFSTGRRMLTSQEEAIYTRSGPGFSCQIHSQINLNNSRQRGARLTITELDEEACSHDNQSRCNYSGALALALAPTPVSVYYPSRTNNENEYDNDVDKGDGITHSLPCKKYGPYTCPRCFGKFSTSQKFAAHVSSHYKYETKAQRGRRLMAKIRKRNLRLHHSREGITLLPTKAFAQPQPVNMTEAEAKRDGVLSKVLIKEEPADF